MNKSIVVDLDGTVADSYGQAFCDAAKRVCGKTVAVSQLTDYDFTKVTDITNDELIAIFASENYYRHLQPTPGAIETLRRLYNVGYALHYMTVRPSNTHVRAETLEWIAKLELPYNSIHILTYQEGGAGKARLARALGLNYFIEDNPKYATALSLECEFGFLLDTPYNRDAILPNNILRINGFEDMETYLYDEEGIESLLTHKIGVKVA